MLFNSYDFLCLFLPLTLLGHHLLLRWAGGRAAWAWLVAASLLFYAWFYPPYLGLLLGSVAVNYVLGGVVADARRAPLARRRWLTVGVTLNLVLLGGFKYLGFLDANLEALTGIDLPLPEVALPLAISFFTFQQIAYLVDAHRGVTRSHDLLDYVAFVSFFPQLIAGPIVHHAEVIPQIQEARRPTHTDRAVGLTMLAIGLFKKVWIADTFAPVVDLVFGQAAAGEPISVLAAWGGTMAWWFQVYFDFSGYSDMAIGLARLFGVTLPVNFDAPYRSASIVEYWERWHVTLSRFLRDYLYIPLGGNRLGPTRRYVNLIITMLLGGLWHGANWTFVTWGGINGIYLVIVHQWRRVRGPGPQGRWETLANRALTFVAMIGCYHYFRAESLGDAVEVQLALIGITDGGLGTLPGWLVWAILGTFALTQLAPTSQRWLEAYAPVLAQGADRVRWPARLTWRPTVAWAIVIGLLAFSTLPALERADAFVYWAF